MAALIKINFKNFLLFTLVFSQLSSCYNEDNRIKVSDLRNLLSDSVARLPWNLDSFDCKTPCDTLYRNLPYSYDEGLRLVRNKFLDIDSQSISETTKQYAKCLIVSDFVYALFSFQFLGPVYGLAKDSAFVATWAQWDTLPLKVCYDIGNTNQVSLFCSQRTSFYLRLVNDLLKVKGYSVTIPNGVHVFPVLKLQSGEYIFDPFDPFVICDNDKKWVIDYPSLLKGKWNGNFKPKRTKRIFGNTRQLFSLTYMNMLKESYRYKDKECFCCVIREYLKENRSFLMSKLKPCFEIPDQPLFQNTHVIPNSHNLYSIDMIGRVDGPLVSHKDIVRYYIGLDCDQISASKSEEKLQR